jgi:hypothetical protein
MMMGAEGETTLWEVRSVDDYADLIGEETGDNRP